MRTFACYSCGQGWVQDSEGITLNRLERSNDDFHERVLARDSRIAVSKLTSILIVKCVENGHVSFSDVGPTSRKSFRASMRDCLKLRIFLQDAPSITFHGR